MAEKQTTAGAHHHIPLESIDSTHRYALEHSAELPDGAVITAQHQRAGRGRRGRGWEAPPGEALLLSLLIKPDLPATDAPLLTPIAAVALAELLEAEGVSTRIRWPNDLLVGERKIAGILAEAQLAGERLAAVVVSVGLNVNQGTEAMAAIDRPATSLFIESGARRDPATLCVPWLARFDAHCDRFRTEGFAAILPEWERRALPAGTAVALDLGMKIVQGRIAGYGVDGALIVRDDAGRETSCRAGEIARCECF